MDSNKKIQCSVNNASDILKKYRKRIDKIDTKIGKLIKERVEIIKEVGKFKAKKNISVKDEKRVDEIYKNLAETTGLFIDDVKKIYSPLIEYCINTEEKIRESYKEERQKQRRKYKEERQKQRRKYKEERQKQRQKQEK